MNSIGKFSFKLEIVKNTNPKKVFQEQIEILKHLSYTVVLSFLKRSFQGVSVLLFVRSDYEFLTVCIKRFYERSWAFSTVCDHFKTRKAQKRSGIVLKGYYFCLIPAITVDEIFL